MSRLVAHESKGRISAQSNRGAQGMMQLMPDTARDFVKRQPLYQPLLSKLSPTLLRYLEDPKVRASVETFVNKKSSEYDIQVALQSLMLELFNPEANLVLGHLYFAGLQRTIRPKIQEYQPELSDFFSELSFEHYAKIIASRKAIRERQPELEYFQEEYASRLSRDERFAVVTESLIQYNGGIRRPKESFLFAAIVQA